jgi:pimeloyl-ACP methyl ester carboxylesterase
MDFEDDTLEQFAAVGPPALPPSDTAGFTDSDGARIWSASFGTGAPVILLHGGMGNAGNWGHQVPALVAAGRQVVVIDSRGHGRSTWDGRSFSYEQMADDVLAVMDARGIERAPIVGWSDGACTGLAMARKQPGRVGAVLFFACNVDETGTHPFEFTERIGRCLTRHKADYAALSPTPDRFDAFSEALGEMQRTQPNYSAAELAQIDVPVLVAQAEFDEFIRPEHAEYLARTLQRAGLIMLPSVSHFAPVQRPAQFNTVVLDWLDWLGG